MRYGRKEARKLTDPEGCRDEMDIAQMLVVVPWSRQEVVEAITNKWKAS